MDFQGRGYITEEDFINSIIMQRIAPFTVEDVRSYFQHANLFSEKAVQNTLTKT